MIAGEQRFLLLQGETHVVRSVSWRVDAIDRVVRAGDGVSVAHHDIGRERPVAALFDLHAFFRLAGTVAAERISPGARPSFNGCAAGE